MSCTLNSRDKLKIVNYHFQSFLSGSRPVSEGIKKGTYLPFGEVGGGVYPSSAEMSHFFEFKKCSVCPENVLFWTKLICEQVPIKYIFL